MWLIAAHRRNAVVGLVLLTGGLLPACSSSAPPADPPSAMGSVSPSSSSRTPSSESAAISSRRFFAEYVTADGRVVRHDQGGDTVSEGQGYAMLLAVALRDQRRFETVWNWTRRHLQLRSGLFAYRWSGGQVASSTPATDADLQIGWALSLAGAAWQNREWTSEAGAIGRAIAAADIGYDDTGNPVLAAGPWAVRSGTSTVTEPGYWTPPAISALAGLTGDNRLKDLGTAELAHQRQLTGNGRMLPPDWAKVGNGSDPTPIAAPDGSAPVQSGPDGLRSVIWTACAGRDGRQLAARWWPLLRRTAEAAPLALTLNGAPRNQDKAALTAVAAAAAAGAARDSSAMNDLLDRAGAIDDRYPTYYGAAWVALGRTLLTTGRLADC